MSRQRARPLPLDHAKAVADNADRIPQVAVLGALRVENLPQPGKFVCKAHPEKPAKSETITTPQRQRNKKSLTLGPSLQLTLPVEPLGHGGLKPLHLHMELTDLRPELGHHLLNLVLLRSTTRVEATPTAPGAAVPDAAAGAGTAVPDAAGLVDGPGACAAVLVAVAADVVDADARPNPSAAATISVAATGAGVPVPAAVAAFVVTTEAGVPTPVMVVKAGTPTSAATAAFATAAGAGFLASPATAVPIVAAGADSLSFVAIAVPVAIAGATAPVSTTTVRAAHSSSASSSRSITSPVGGPPGAMPCPTGSAEEAEGGAGVRPCPVPGCGTTPPVAAARATSAVGFAVSPATPPLAAGGVVVCPAEVDDTRSAFFGASDGMRPRGVAL
ncbi:ice-structuring glycoprotein-like [Setaria italica]|uniref:ice-structuring glycoprotein-like n=1 Tax=Setaria italica TaxID=4555 RepID=UPI000350B13A|nr:ice-structuring glycoprotein-like [Setaria italica]